MADSPHTVKSAVRWTALALTALAVALTGIAVHARGVRAGDRELLRIGVEDVARRVKSTTANLATVIEAGNSMLLTKVRAFARLIAADPSLVEDAGRFAAVRETLDVDELHVSDADGILVQSAPATYVGYDMKSSDQSRPFMRAIDDPAFELVQDPMFKGADGQIFQYAGCARIDRPGIVQVGQRAERVIEAKKLADVAEIAKSARLGRNGRIQIVPLSEAGHGASGLRIERSDGGRGYVLPTDVGGYRVLAKIPVYGPVIADDLPFAVLCVLDVLLILVVFVLVVPGVRIVALRHFRLLKVLFSGPRGGPGKSVRGAGVLRRMALNPLALVCLFAFTAATLFFRFACIRYAHRASEEVLLTAADDIRASIDDCVDLPLCFVGKAICRHYGSPERMTQDEVAEVMRRYDIDELNVVNSRGVIVAGALADLGYEMSSNPKSAEFNCLLNGAESYSQDFRGAIENPGLRRKYVGVAFPPPARGYIQIGFAEPRVKDDIDYWFRDLAVGWHVGESGFYVVAKAETGEIDSCGHVFPPEMNTLAALGFDFSSAPRDPKTPFRAVLGGIPCLCLTEEVCFHRVITALPLAEVEEGIGRATGVLGGVLATVLVIVVFFMTRLSDLVESLKVYIATERERQEKEFSLARVVQLSSLPLDFPDTPSFRVTAKMVTTKEVGGDFYDFYRLPSGRQLVLVADVSGKGISAAMFMMKARTIVKTCVTGVADLARAVTEANGRLARHNDAEMFVTAWIASIDPATGEVEYVNAGHNPPLVRRADGSVEWIDGRKSLVLAAMDGVGYQTDRLVLKPGDRLFLYTDGVTEAMDPDGAFYGEARLHAALAAADGDLLKAVEDSVHAHVRGAEQSDDITMLAFDFKGVETA